VIIIAFGATSFQLYLKASAAEGRAVQLAQERTNEMLRYQSLSKKITFSMFLQEWSDGQTRRALQFQHLYESMFDADSGVKNAAGFLIDARSLQVKEQQFRDKLQDDERWLGDFLVAEEFAKAGNREKALILYEKSISYINADRTSLKKTDDWLAELISNRFESFKAESK
jgi:hypothetical protein